MDKIDKGTTEALVIESNIDQEGATTFAFKFKNQKSVLARDNETYIDVGQIPLQIGFIYLITLYKGKLTNFFTYDDRCKSDKVIDTTKPYYNPIRRGLEDAILY